MSTTTPGTGRDSIGGRAGDYEDDWIEPERRSFDWKKAILILGLGALSWVATYVGMLELIQSNMGELPLVTKVIIGFSVAMLMTMIIWLLDQLFAPLPFVTKAAYLAGYVFLTLISVGFGFGFYWKVLESRSEASRSAESAVSQVQAALLAGSSRLDQLQTTLSQLTVISLNKAVLERERGTSCPNSRPGDGPRRRLRDADAARFSFASEFVKGRSGQVKADMAKLDVDLKKITSRDASTFDAKTGTRNAFLQALSRKLDLTATGFNAFRTDPQLRQIRSELAERANRTTFPNSKGGTFSCPDPQLQSALLGVVKAIDQLPELGKPEIATVEGSQAVVEAFRRLTATFQGALTFKLPPSADELRELQKRAIRSADPAKQAARFGGTPGSGLSQGGLSQRDYIPLAIAVFVDLCLLLVSIGRPMNRFNNLVPKMRQAERGPVYQILSKFDDIHRDEEIREKFEVFRHVVFDFNGDYYVAVPLDAPRNRNPDEVKSLQLESLVLNNMFASLEKEKIFSRVYNPLLSRKMVQKKLWRQGSKFASSQAFRIYRFRDGAWSDIILGAVMGAARRAKMDRVRRAREAGPQLDLPDNASEADVDEAANAERIIREALAEQHAPARAQFEEPPVTFRNDPRYRQTAAAAALAEDDEDVAAAFGPYAANVREHVDARSALGAEANVASRDPGPRWPYRRPAPPPGEADVEMMPANSNTYPPLNEAAETDNVIPMPRLQPEEARPAPQSEIEAVVAEQPSAKPKPPPLPVEPLSAPPERIADEPAVQEAAASEAEQLMETSMNVRITQRTADFEIPLTVAAHDQTMAFLRAGMNASLNSPSHAEVPTSQLTFDLEAEPASDARGEASQDVILLGHDEERRGTSEPGNSSDLPVELLDPPAEEEVPQPIEVVRREPGQPSDDRLEEISRRFAPRRNGE